MRILKNLRIDEVSCVIKGANPGAKVMIRKSDDGPLLFNDIIKADPIEDEPDALTDKLKAMVDALIVANPGMSEQLAMNYLMHSPNGRLVAQHLNSISKRKEEPVTQVDIFKLSNINSVVEIAKSITKGDAEISEHDFTKVLQGHAMLTKSAGESVGAAFERLLTASTADGAELRKAYILCKGMTSAGAELL
jgi:hypothetical protein